MSKVATEVAQQEFERWAETFEIDISTDAFDPEELKAFDGFKAKFIKRIETGALTIDDDGVIEFSPRGDDGDPLKFDEPTGALLSARQKNDTEIQAARRVLASWTGVAPKRFAEMKLRDFNFCSELLAFFGNS
ncbi:hypothetical protein [Oceanospirillum phage vB_OsaM_PD0307]|nr:hypothetical protein [Oceanospirillum phage vB_OsaM_PD0307]